jgi:hypothetical protein
MKIAYLILAHSNYNHLKRLVSALNDSNVVFFIHIDDTLKLPNNLNEFDNVVFTRGPKVYWAGWSTVDAYLRLIRTATSFVFDYYVLISGADYPIRPNSFLYNQLSTGGEFINIIQGFSEHKSESRIKYYYFDGFDRRNTRSIKTVFFLLLEGIGKLFFQKKTHPFKQIYHGSTWWALTHDCLLYVLDQTGSNKEYERFYKTCWDPDESIFQTIIGNSPFLSKCKTNITYTDWSSEPAPALINQSHIDLFKRNIEFQDAYGTYTPFFARKFDDNSAKIVELIDKKLRS